MCNHLSEKELLTGKGKSEEEKGRKKSNGCTPISYLATRRLDLFNPPAQKKKCLKEEVYYFGGYVPKHSAGDTLYR